MTAPPPPLPLRVTRAPVLTLWAAVVAARLGHAEALALTLGAALAGTGAAGMAARPLAEGVPAPPGMLRLMGHAVPVDPSTGLAGGLQDPGPIRAYLERAFGPRLGEVRAALEALAGALPPQELDRRAFGLFQQFQPDPPAHGRGKGLLHPARIAAALAAPRVPPGNAR